jgi:hypothetical protein
MPPLKRDRNTGEARRNNTMLSKAELEAPAEKYEAKVSRAYQNYQETGITRYDRERRNAEDLASAMRMAASAERDYTKLVNIRGSVSMLASKAQLALKEQEDKRESAMEKVLKDLVALAVMEGLVTDDELR